MIKAASYAAPMAEALKPGVGYLRKSTGEQVASIPDQKRFILEYAARHGIRIVRWYTDSGISGDQWDRPDFQRLLDDCTHHKDFDVLLVWDSSRFSRLNEAKSMIAYGTIFDAGVEFVTVSKDKRVNPKNVADHIMLTIDNHSDHDKVTKISDDSSRAISVLMSNGKWARGRIAFGYVNDLGPRVDRRAARLGTGKLKIDPIRGPLVLEIFQMFVFEDISSIALAKRLNSDSRFRRPNGKPWSSKGVRYMLQNPIYLGHSRYCMNPSGKYNVIVGGQVVESDTPGIHSKLKVEPYVIRNTHEHLIDVDLFNAASERLLSRTFVKRRSFSYALSGLIHCAHCGCRLRGKPDKQRRTYFCCSKHELLMRGAACKHKPTPLCGSAVSAEFLHKKVCEKVYELCLSEPAIEGFRLRIEAYLRNRSGQSQSAAKSLEKETEKCRREVERFVNLLGQTDDSDLIVSYQSALKAAKERQRILSAQLDTEKHLTTIGSRAVTADAARVVDQLRKLRDKMQSNPNDSVLRSAMLQIVERVEVTFEPINKRERRVCDVVVDIKPFPIAAPNTALDGVTLSTIVNTPTDSYDPTSICWSSQNWPRRISFAVNEKAPHMPSEMKFANVERRSIRKRKPR